MRFKRKKIGRSRPVLYRGKFNVPQPIVKRLVAAMHHLILAKVANFNARVDQCYLAIDHLLSSVIMMKEGTLTTKDHRKKYEKFIKYFGKKAKSRKIEVKDFENFYKLWMKSRYKQYLPNSFETEKMELFASHLLSFIVIFGVTLIARTFVLLRAKKNYKAPLVRRAVL